MKILDEILKLLKLQKMSLPQASLSQASRPQKNLLVKELQKPDENIKELVKFLKDPKNSNDHTKGANEWFTCSGIFSPANDFQMAQKRSFITNLKISCTLPYQQLLVRIVYEDWIDTFALVAKFGNIRLWETSQNRCVPAATIKKIEVYHKDQLLDSQDHKIYKLEFEASTKQYHFDGSGRKFERVCPMASVANLPKNYEVVDPDFYGKKLIKYETVRYDV